MLKNHARSGFLWSTFSLLAFSIVIGAHFYFGPHPIEKTNSPSIEALIPKDLCGWQFEAIPLGDTPEALTRAENILRFSSAYACRYTFAEHHLVVYAAYWAPGIASPREVGSHTPDICWVRNGWEPTHRSGFNNIYIQNHLLRPCENRIYTKNGNSEQVIFWHLVEHQSYNFRGMEFGDGSMFWQDLKTYGLNQNREQYLIRLSSDLPWDALWNNRNFQKLLLALKPLGIFEPPADRSE